MDNQEKLRIYKRALRNYQRLASDFIEYNHLNYQEIKKHYADIGYELESVFIIMIGNIKAYLIHYHSELLSSITLEYSLSIHIVIYATIDNQWQEWESLSLPTLKGKIEYLKSQKD